MSHREIATGHQLDSHRLPSRGRVGISNPRSGTRRTRVIRIAGAWCVWSRICTSSEEEGGQDRGHCD